jgi:hypothetical protein
VTVGTELGDTCAVLVACIVAAIDGCSVAATDAGVKCRSKSILATARVKHFVVKILSERDINALLFPVVHLLFHL